MYLASYMFFYLYPKTENLALNLEIFFDQHFAWEMEQGNKSIIVGFSELKLTPQFQYEFICPLNLDVIKYLFFKSLTLIP